MKRELDMRSIILIIVAGCLFGATPVPTIAQGAPAAGALLAQDARQAGDRADDTAALSDQWKKGARMVADGEKLVKRSDHRLVDLARDAKSFQARADKAVAAQSKERDAQAKGQQMIADGRGLQAQAEGNSQAGSGA
jgi:hypothetical protein